MFGWYIAPALSDMLPDATLKAIYWIGLLLYWASAVILVPILMIWGGKGDFKGCIQGLVVFFSGYVMSIILFYTIGYILEAMESIWTQSSFVAIGWGAIYLLSILGMIVLPVGLTVKDAIRS